ncbi:helix-turn-helix transcriptional regulator [Aestuariibius insulae]|uniref:helix-turn-helix transcriptional regulator n=1 Tax=Aestuariibius insulae TaxID=2058287 RepID=UPI00345E09E9
MRRADRLFRLVDLLRGGDLMTAEVLADQLEVSVRTVYRDMADLMANGVPITGEAGVGYVMGGGWDLPPMMFTEDEIVALVGGARMIQAWGGTEMAAGADAALKKIAAVLPSDAKRRIDGVHVHAMRMPRQTPDMAAALDRIETATEGRQRLSFDYQDEAGAETRRTVRPLGLWFWGQVWTLVGWCELREDFRMFRVDRMADLTGGGAFRLEPGQTLRDFRLQHVEGCGAEEAPARGLDRETPGDARA